MFPLLLNALHSLVHYILIFFFFFFTLDVLMPKNYKAIIAHITTPNILALVTYSYETPRSLLL